jgi:hypothetical protein
MHQVAPDIRTRVPSSTIQMQAATTDMALVFRLPLPPFRRCPMASFLVYRTVKVRLSNRKKTK